MVQLLQLDLQYLLSGAVQILLLLIGLGTSLCCLKTRNLNEEEIEYELGLNEKGVKQQGHHRRRHKGDRILGEKKRKKKPPDAIKRISIVLEDVPCALPSGSRERNTFASAEKAESDKRSGTHACPPWVHASSENGWWKGPKKCYSSGKEERNGNGKDTDDSYFRVEQPYENMVEQSVVNGIVEKFGKEYDYHATQDEHTKELFETIGPLNGNSSNRRMNSDGEIHPKKCKHPSGTLFDNAGNGRGHKKHGRQGKGSNKKKKKGKEHGHKKVKPRKHRHK